MKKLGLLLFLACFLLLALAPAVGMLVFGPSQAAANEILAQPPQVTEDDGSFNFQVLNDASDYLKDRFWLRQELITVNAAIEASVFRESASEDVLLGKAGWLFFAETLDDYQGQNSLTQRQLWAAAHTLGLIREYAEDNGVRLLFVPVPNKNSVYPEKMPDSAVPTDESTNYERLLAALSHEGVETLDLLPRFLAHKDEIQLYHSLDSHWNNLGAALAHDAILEALGMEGTAYYPDAFVLRRDHEADLYAMLYPAGTALDEQFYPDRDWAFSYARPIRSPEDQRIQTTAETPEGRLLMFRDSFGNTLHAFLAEDFSSALFSRAMPYDLRLLKTQQPDILILEIVERNLEWLAQRPPILPAPVRTLDLSAALPAASCLLNVGEDDTGFFHVNGELSLDPDPDSPVWIEANGIIYEASPVGETERSFAAYLPEAAAGWKVYWRTNGVLLAVEAAVHSETQAPSLSQ